MVGRKFGHKLVAFVVALSPVEPKREGNEVGDVAETAGVSFGSSGMIGL
jgi:hypothetical protein